jgi:hypothetical protein
MNEWGVRNIVVEASQYIVCYSFAGCVLDIVRLLHLVFVAFIEDIGVQDQY